MADLGKAQTGKRSSTPKICRINADDNLPIIYKNMGNNHTAPVMWADTVVLSGTTTTVASGVVIHGLDLATYAIVTATPRASVGTASHWIERDTAANTLTLTSSASQSNVTFDVIVMLGMAPSSRYIEGMYCRGNTGAQQSLP